MHYWGDDWFKEHGDNLYSAINAVEKRIRKWARMGVCGKEKWGCFTESAEILTKDGWKNIKDITMEDEVATLKDGEYLEYNRPTDIIHYHYEGKMYKLVNRGLDILVTPNHNLYVSKGSYFKNGEKRCHPFELTTPDTYFGQDKRFKKDVKWDGKTPEEFFVIPATEKIVKVNRKSKPYTRIDHYSEVRIEMKPFLKFLGFYVAEGFTYKTTINIAHNPYTETELAKSLISNMGFIPHTNKPNSFKYFSQPLLREWITNNCGRGAENKKVPSFIKELDKESIRLFLEYLYIGDGHQAKTSNILTTTSKQLSDDVCELILKCGDTFRVRIRDRHKTSIIKESGHKIISKKPSYEINWMKNKEVEIETSKVRHGLIKNFTEEWVDYDGEVYCCTVPNHIIYVRQNGKGYWCGNCYRDEYLTFWNGGLAQIFCGYRVWYGGSWWTKLWFKIDHSLIPIKKTKFGWLKVGLSNFNRMIGLVKLVNKWQARMLNKAFQVTCKEYPDVIDELVADTDCYKCIKPSKWGNVDGELIHIKYWTPLKPSAKTVSFECNGVMCTAVVEEETEN